MALRSRWTRRVVRSVVLGVITSVLLSIGAGVVGGNATIRYSSSVGWRTRADFSTTSDYTIQVPSQTDPGDSMDVTAARHARLAFSDGYLPPGAPRPAYFDANANAGYPVRHLRVTTSGLPFASFWGYFAADALNAPGGSATISKGGDLLSLVAPSTAARASRIFPYWPLWGGLIANAAIHSAGWLMVFAVIPAVVARRRTWRGRCAGCGYDRRGLVAGSACPECAAPG